MKRYFPAGLVFSLVLFLGSAVSSAQGAEKTLRCWRCHKTFIVPASQRGEATCSNCGARCIIKSPTPVPTPKPVPSSSPVPSLSPVPGSEPASISWRDGARYVGQIKTVKGKIVGSHLSSGSGNLYLNFDPDFKTYLSIKIPKEDLGKFPSGAAAHYNGKTVVATGKIVHDKNYLRIIIADPANLKVLD